MWVRDLSWEDSLKQEMATYSSILGKFHGQRNLESPSLWGCKELDTTEQLNTYAHKTCQIIFQYLSFEMHTQTHAKYMALLEEENLCLSNQLCTWYCHYLI